MCSILARQAIRRYGDCRHPLQRFMGEVSHVRPELQSQWRVQARMFIVILVPCNSATSTDFGLAEWCKEIGEAA